MAYLRKTRAGGQRWVAQIPNPSGSGKLLQKSIRARNQREADWIELELRQRARSEQQPGSSHEASMSLDELVRGYLDERPSAPESARVRRHLTGSDLGSRRIDAVRSQDIENFLDAKQAGGLSPQSVNHLRRLLASAYNRAGRKGLFTGPNPASGVQKRRVPKGTVGDYLRVHEVPLLLPALAPRFRPLFATAI